MPETLVYLDDRHLGIGGAVRIAALTKNNFVQTVSTGGIVLVHDLDIRVLTGDGELIRELVLDPSRDYQPQPKP